MMKNKPFEAAHPIEIDSEIQQFAAAIQCDYERWSGSGEDSLERRREVAEKVRERWVRGGPEMESVSDHVVPFGENGVTVRIFDPGSGERSPALVYLHGGGWTIFSLNTHSRLMRELAARTGYKVVGVDFSLAPEARFPVQLDEIAQVIAWLCDEGPQLGIDPHQLSIGGDSVGANMALASCLKLRDQGSVGVINAMALFYGAFEPGPAYAKQAPETDARFLLTHDEMRSFWRNYLNGPEDLPNPLACPMRADVHDLPPAFMAIADCDILLEENIVLASRLEHAGVPVKAVVYPGTTHSFLEAISIAAVADRALAESSTWLTETVSGN